MPASTRPLLRFAPILLILTYLVLSAAPFLPYLLGRTLESPWQIVSVEVLCWIAVWALFKRPAWFHWLLIPAFLTLPTEVYLQYFYGQGITTHHIGIITETSPREALEFLGRKVWLLLFIIVGIIVWWVVTWRIACRTRALDWGHKSRWLALLCICALVYSIWHGEEFGVSAKPLTSKSASKLASKAASNQGAKSASLASTASGFGDDEEEDDEDASEEESASVASGKGAHEGKYKLPYWAHVPLTVDHLIASRPFGLPGLGIDFYHERKYLAELAVKNRDFKFGAHQNQSNTQPQTIVMVIGESSRFDRWSINGYERETNPLLSRESNLVSLADVITPVSATRLSVPIIISRKPVTQSLKDGFSEKSFLTAFKEAGFKTWWLSNQISFGHFDTPVSVFAKEADVVQFMNLGGFTDNSNFDQILLEPLQSALQDPNPKKLIVLHSLGNHWNYSHRYPKEFDKWQPSLFGVDKPVYTDLKIKPALNNSYDNSILYTDWFLSRVIGTLKTSGQQSSMMYIADHGQTLYDDTCNLAFHGHNTQFEFHVPSLVWYSDAFEQAYPDKVAQLKKHRKSRLATENVFHSLLDLADIHYPTERLEWSMFNSQFQQHKRYVDSYGWTNYDNAIIKGACHEVIDKDKPLKQEK